MAVIVKDGINHYIPIGSFELTKGMTPGLDAMGLREKHDTFVWAMGKRSRLAVTGVLSTEAGVQKQHEAPGMRKRRPYAGG